MLLVELRDEDGFDDHDRARASDMEESRPIYPRIFLAEEEAPDHEEVQPDEPEA